MGREILMSIHPEWVTKNASGEKTVEVRKTAPLEKCPFRVFIYQTKPKSGDWNDMDGRVVGEFMCKQIWEINTKAPIMIAISKNSCVPITGMQEYAGSRGWIYGWEISDVRMYEKPYSLQCFARPCGHDKPCSECLEDYDNFVKGFLCRHRVKHPPQSWMYVEKVILE